VREAPAPRFEHRTEQRVELRDVPPQRLHLLFARAEFREQFQGARRRRRRRGAKRGTAAQVGEESALLRIQQPLTRARKLAAGPTDRTEEADGLREHPRRVFREQADHDVGGADGARHVAHRIREVELAALGTGWPRRRHFR
jgi:hypothetical protein